MRSKPSAPAIDLNIYVAGRSDQQLNIEMHFGAGGMVPFNQWQQYEFKFQNNRPINIKQGYVLLEKNDKPEIMPKSFFTNNTGVHLEDFLFVKHSEIEQYYIGEEAIEVPAGIVTAKHYKKEANGQIIDFWISSKVDPIGIVKIISKGELKEQNYQIELNSMLENVKASIDSNQAQKMSESTKKYFKIK
jgi:hypothetical protein